MRHTRKITVSMLDFLRTGQFGPVHLGISRDQLRDYLGEPEAWSLGSSRHPTRTPARAAVWKYGDVEFHFNGNTLVLIFADHVRILKGGEAIDLNPWVLSGKATVKQVLSDLEAAQISCQRIDWKFDSTTERFRFGAGVELLFWDEVQHSANNEELPPLAPADMTFHGFSYRMEGTTR